MSRRRSRSVPGLRPTIALACMVAALGAWSVARADPPLWRVMGPHAEVDLFGSLHLLSQGPPWFTPRLQGDLAKADEVWFEIPLGGAGQAEAARLIQARGLQPPGQTLWAELGPALTARVQAVAARVGANPAVLERSRPWLAELALTLAFYQKQGFSSDLGVEGVIDKAAPAGAARGAFETVAEQVALFADDPEPEQIASLRETLDEIDKDPGIFARAADDWRRGDVAGLVRDVITPMRQEDEAVYQRLIVARNRRFAARIEALSRGDRRVFVVVGAGHLVGPDGVPAMLRRDGLKVEGP